MAMINLSLKSAATMDQFVTICTTKVAKLPPQHKRAKTITSPTCEFGFEAKKCSTVEPLYSGHHWDHGKCPDFRGLILYTFVCICGKTKCPDLRGFTVDDIGFLNLMYLTDPCYRVPYCSTIACKIESIHQFDI